MVVRWRADSGPIVRADWIFYKVIRNMATEKLQVQKVPIEISIPNSTLDAWIQRGLGGPDPTPPPIPLKITCSMGFYRNKHPPPPENKQKDIYPASSQTQRGPVQLFSGISNVHRGNTYETFSLHLQNSIRDGEVGNYLFLTDVRIQREIGGLDTPQLKINNNHKFFKFRWK